MNCLRETLFFILGCSLVYSLKCPPSVSEAVRQIFTEKCKSECSILRSDILSENSFLDGFCIENVYFLFPFFGCGNDKNSWKVQFFIEATPDYCNINNLTRYLDENCLKKFFTKKCKISKRENSTLSADVAASTVQTTYSRETSYNSEINNFDNNHEENGNFTSLLFSSVPFSLFTQQPLFNVSVLAPSSESFINENRINSNIEKTFQIRTNTSPSPSALSIPINPVGSEFIRSSDNHFSRNITDFTDTFCGSKEKFYNDHCYYLLRMKPLSLAMEASDKFYQDLLFSIITRSEIIDIPITACQMKYFNGLGLAVESKSENEFVKNFLTFYTFPFDSLILTSGYKKSNFAGIWNGWNENINETFLLKHKSENDSNDLFYTLKPGNASWKKLTIGDVFFKMYIGEWFIVCERPYSLRYISPEFQKKCLKLHNESNCDDLNHESNYCCAIDEMGEVWYECANRISTKRSKDGSLCMWRCGNDGNFEQEHPKCMKQIDCEGTFNKIKYSAPAQRYAVGNCPKNLYGYSTWFCNEDNIFEGSPNYNLCCKTRIMCVSTDSFLNVWAACPMEKASKKITCPPDSLLEEATVEWYCTENKIFNGSAPDYSTCNRATVICEGTDKYGRRWRAGAGVTAQKKCPNSFNGLCLWTCSFSGNFETSEPDCSTCRASWMDDISDKIKNGTHYKEVMDEIKNHTDVEDLSIGFSFIIDLASDAIDLFKQQKTNSRDLFHEFLIAYSQILKNIAGKPSLWASFMVNKREEYGNQILKSTLKASFAYLTSVESDTEEVLYNSTFTDLKNDGFDFFVVYNPSMTGLTFPLENNDKNYWQLKVERISGEGSVFAAMGLIMNYSISSLMFPLNGSELITSRNQTAGMKLNAPVVTFTVASVNNKKEQLISDVRVFVTFKHEIEMRFPNSRIIKRRLHEGETPSGIFNSTACYYYGKPNWNKEGCEVVHTSKQYTTCSCRHLSTIGILMNMHEYVPNSTLETVSLITSSITIISLMLSLAIFYSFHSIDKYRVLIGKNLSICLLLGHILVISVMDKKFFYFSDELCVFFAILMHYIFTASFAWMFVEGCHLYRMLVVVFDSDKKYRFIYFLTGYGSPLFVVGLTSMIGYALQEEPYGQDELCWLKVPNYIWAFNVPVVILTSVNFYILIIAMKLAVTSRKSNKFDFKNLRVWVKGWISLSVLLGLTWIFGLFYINYNEIFDYIFVILNGLQGLFILLFRCLWNEQYNSAVFQKLRSFFFSSNDWDSSKKCENGRSGTKLFAITCNHSKSSGPELETTIVEKLNKQIKIQKNILQRLDKFSFFDSKKCKTSSDASSGIECDYTSSSGNPSKDLGNRRKNDAGEKSKEFRANSQDDFPELSYHTNYY